MMAELNGRNLSHVSSKLMSENLSCCIGLINIEHVEICIIFYSDFAVVG